MSHTHLYNEPCRDADKRAEEERNMLGAGLRLEDYDEDGNPVSDKPKSSNMSALVSKLSLRSATSMLSFRSSSSPTTGGVGVGGDNKASSNSSSKRNIPSQQQASQDSYVKFKLWLFGLWESLVKWCNTPPNNACRVKFQVEEEEGDFLSVFIQIVFGIISYF
jgi:hypothetical protein